MSTKPTKAKPGKPGRKRRAVGWTLLLLGLLVAGLWVASGWYSLSRVRPLPGGMIHEICSAGSYVRARTMAYYLVGEGSLSDTGWRLEKRDPEDGVGWGWRYGDSNHTLGQGVTMDVLTVPLWPIPVLLLTPAALLLRSGYLARRRAMTGMCAKCGYSLAGLTTDSPCPECGKAKTSLG